MQHPAPAGVGRGRVQRRAQAQLLKQASSAASSCSTLGVYSNRQAPLADEPGRQGVARLEHQADEAGGVQMPGGSGSQGRRQ